MRLKFKLILMFFLAFALQVSAQEKTVTGLVTEQGMPLPGVNISIQGVQSTAQTDIDGKYSIKASVGQTLVFTYLGMENATAVVGTSNVLDVAMTTSATQLEGVVVEVAYGRQRKKAIVGSIATVGREILETQQLTNVTAAIQGSVPGVNVISSGGQPGEAPTIRVRGIGSINASASPLIIVDGAAYNGNLNAISQDQIETMSVLKDASSTALYGSRGSNGVILITTRKGKRNSAPKVRLSTQTGIAQRAVDMYDMVGSEDFLKYSWEADKNRRMYVLTPGQSAAAAGAAASTSLIGRLGYNPYNVASPIDASGNLVEGASLLWETDWEKEIYRKTAIRTEHSLSFEGGSDNTSYFFSTNYLNQEGAVKTSDFERITTRLNLDSKIKDWLQVGVNTSIGISNQSFPDQSGNAFGSANQWIYNVSSIYPLYRRDAAGALALDDLGNPVYDYGATTGQSANGTRPLFSNENAVGALYNNSNKNRRTSTTINGYAKVNFTDYLSYRASLSYEQYQLANHNYTSNLYGAAASVGGRVSQDKSETTTLNHISSLNFEKSFGNHKINADAIFEAYQRDYDYLAAQGTGFLSGVKSLSGSTAPEFVSGYLNQDRMVSYLGRIGYSYADKYFIEGSYRSDSSTKFSAATRRGDFYSIGGSWIVSDENFLKDSNVLSFLKLKTSYGELGNNTFFDTATGTELIFPYIQGYETGWNQLDNIGVLLGAATNPNLTWEKTASFNAGVEFGLFNNRLEGGVEYYNKKSIDLAYNQPLTTSTGNATYFTNVGSLRNYGIEVSLNSKNIISDDITWTTGLNFSFDRNEITELTQDSFINGSKRWEVGRSLYDFYLREWAGVDSADGRGMWYMDSVDAAGNTVKVTTKDYNQATRYYSKSSLPDVIGGFTNYFRYKNFDLNILFNFSYGGYLYDSQYASLMSGFSGAGRAASVDIADRWQNPGDETDVPLLLNSANNHASSSTRFLFKNDYVRLKALTLGYNLPDVFAEKMNMSKFRLYLQGDNLWTYQSHKGLDPEQNLAGTTNNTGYNMRTVSLGVKVEF